MGTPHKYKREYHGYTDSPTHNSWRAMHARCNDPRNERYKAYGGRGIKVCEQWEKFTGFLADMGERPEGYTLDRIDLDKDYCPENCRWLTRAEQMKNMKQTIWVTIDDRKMCLLDWCKELGLNYSTVYGRVSKGIDPVAALTPGNLKRRNKKNGQFEQTGR